MESVRDVLKILEAVARGKMVDEINLLGKTKAIHQWATNLNTDSKKAPTCFSN